jgi:hypothetical protein
MVATGSMPASVRTSAAHRSIDALALHLRRGGDSGVDFRADPQHQLAGVGALWWATGPLADLQAALDRLVEVGLQFVDCRPMEPDDIVDSGQVAYEDAIVFIVFDPGDVVLVFHRVHGAIPALVRKARASLMR